MREISFQSFEVINVEMLCPARDESKGSESLMESLKDSLTIIKDGHPKDGEDCLNFLPIRTVPV